MTGKDLILYILQNNLENEPVIKNGVFIGFTPADKIAAQMNVGTASINVILDKYDICGYISEDTLYVPANLRELLSNMG